MRLMHSGGKYTEVTPGDSANYPVQVHKTDVAWSDECISLYHTFI